MSINGVETIVFSAVDPSDLIRFFEDFGLSGKRSAGGADFLLPEGSKVLVRRDDDPSLPPKFLAGDGPREVVWGVDCQAALDDIEKDLRRDREVTKDDDGTLHTIDPAGLRIGFRIFTRIPLEKKVVNQENSLTHRPRWNTIRSQYERATPKVIQHVVFATDNIDEALEFYTKRLQFRVTDVSRGRGAFLRADGRNEHHNLFFINRPLSFNHIAFGLESIDELMVGANHMQRKGWTSKFGLGRHRISSIIFFYMTSPVGGEVEYTADGDFLDDNWQPGLWEPDYGNRYWMAGEAPPILQGEGVVPLPNPIPKFKAAR